MITVGVRDLKNGLTRYLRVVQGGATVVITVRNRPVAVLKKPSRQTGRTREERIAALIAEGRLLRASDPGPVGPFTPVRVGGKAVSTVIMEDRR